MSIHGAVGWTSVLFAVLVATHDAHASGSPAAKRVLVLYSFRHGLPAHDIAGANEMVNRGIHSVFGSSVAENIRLHFEYLEVSAWPEAVYLQRVADDLREEYAELPVDVIIAVNHRALRFLTLYGESTFPGCPIVFCGVEKRRAETLELGENVTGVLGEATFGETAAAVLHVLPDTKRLFVVVGTSETDRFIEAVSREELRPFEGRIEVVYPEDRSLGGLIRQVASLPEHSVVLFHTLLQSGPPDTSVPENALSLLSEASSVPTFGVFGAYLGQGIVGGDLYSSEIQGETAARLALRVMAGEKPADIGIVEAQANQLMFDWRQLQRWGISEKRLPPGSIVRYKELSIWDAYKWRILGVVALCIAQAIIIAYLLMNRRMRRRAERSLAERLAFESLVSEIGASLGGRDTAVLNERVDQWLPRVAHAVSADRCALIDLSGGESDSRTVCMWAVEGVEPLQQERYADTFPWCVKELSAGRIVQFAELDELPGEAEVDAQGFAKGGVRSHVAVPLAIGGSVLGAFTLDRVSRGGSWTDVVVQRTLLLGDIFANALGRQRADSKLRKAFAEINQLKDRLERENVYLRKEVEVRYTYEHIIGESDTIKGTLSQVEQVAGTDTTVLLLGETGTGKDLLANAIHEGSDRRARTMVRVNCAALPPTLIESELFGREKGAYTGAQQKQVGRFEVADGSTIFLDEVAELPPELQAKLLRVLQEGAFERLGSPKPIHVDVRVIAATNRDLGEAVRKARFRQDLYYRLNVFPILVPPLRERGDDIELLVWAFVEEFAKKAGKTIGTIRQQDMDALRRYPWPGNVREVRNVIECAVIVTTGSTLHIDSPQASKVPEAERMSLRDVERRHVLDVLELTHWRVRGSNGAAEILGLKPSTLESRMAKLGIQRPSTSPEMSG